MPVVPHKRKKGLGRKIIIALLIVGSLPVLVGLAITYWSGNVKLRKAMGENFQGLAKQASRKTDLVIGREIDGKKHLSTTQEIRESISTSNKNYAGLTDQQIKERSSELSARWESTKEKSFRRDILLLNTSSYLRNYMITKSVKYIAFFVTDEEGALVASANAFPGYLHSQAEWWRQAYNDGIGKIYIGDLYWNEKANAYALNIAVPVIDEMSRQVVGILAVFHDVRELLQPSIHDIRFGQTGHAMLVDSQGRVLTCPVMPTGSLVMDKALVQNMRSSTPGWVVAKDDGHGGSNSIVGFAPVVSTSQITKPSTGKTWHSFIRQDPSELYAPINSLLTSVSLSGLLLIGFVAVIGVFVARRLTQPIHILHRGAEEIGAGNLDVKLNIRTNDEIEQLAEEFNRMAERLKESYINLEQKVADRTKELSALNIIATTLNESFELHEILENTLGKVLEVLQMEGGEIRFLNDPKDKLILQIAQGLPSDYIEGYKEISIDEMIAGKVASTGHPIVIEDARTVSHPESRLIEMGFVSLVSIPLKSKNDIIGILVGASRSPRSFSHQDMELLTSIGNQLGTAVENAKFYGRERKMVEDLKEVDRIKVEFLTNLSHELRTPLTSIIGFSELLLDRIPGPLIKEQEEYIKNVQSSGQHLLELINNLLDLSKVKAGKMEIHKKHFHLPSLLQAVTSSIMPLVNKKKIQLEVNVQEDISHIYADEGKIKQCILNLLSNACKFTSAGGEIRVNAQPSELEGQSSLLVSVEDTGIGIRKEDFDKLFEEFTQAQGSYTREYQGTGLGLPITQRFVEMQGGKIWVESEEGKGSKFSFLIPTPITYDDLKTEVPEGEIKEASGELEAVPFADPEREQEEMRMPSQKALAHDTVKNEKLCILVVEDDFKTSQLLTRYLTEAGYMVEQAYDGESALEMAKSVKPFAITLDIMLPKMDGWEVLQRLKSRPETCDIPVIIVSIVEEQEVGLSLGAVDYFTKPIDRRTLLESLKKRHRALEIDKKPTTVLVIDDDPNFIRLLAAILESEGIGLIEAQGGEEGIKQAIDIHPDLIVLDLLMPECNGFEVLDQLKKHPTAKNIPVIVCTAKDLATKEKKVLAGKIREVIHKGKTLREDVIHEIRKIEKLYPDKAKMIDGLTGLFNERYFQNRLAEEINRLERFKRPFSLLMANIDHYKDYNKKSGVQKGDQALYNVGNLFCREVRATDILCRRGGSTFSVIMPETLRKHAYMVAERLRGVVEKDALSHDENQAGNALTVSVGVTSCGEGTKSGEEAIARLDRVLQVAKREGGNRVVTAKGDR